LKTVGKIDVSNLSGKKTTEEKKPEHKISAKADSKIIIETPEVVVEDSQEIKEITEAPKVQAEEVSKLKVKKAPKKVTAVEKEALPRVPKEKVVEEKGPEVTAENAEALVTQYKKLDGPILQVKQST